MSIPTPVAPFLLHPAADLVQRYPALRHRSHELAHAYATRRVVTEELLRTMGQQLWQALDRDGTLTAAFAAARQQAGAQTLPVIIESAVAAIQQLPWETLCHPEHGFLARANGFTLLRHVGQTPAMPPLDRGPLRVLLFTALPESDQPAQSRLDVEEEQAQVLEALAPWVADGVVTLEMPNDGRFSTLQVLLRTFKPHLLFLSGHGKFIEGPGQEPHARFLFEGETSGSHAVHETMLANALLGSGVSCVVLSACESGMGASGTLNSGLSWRLSHIGIPHVIGMREAVLDQAGIRFAHAFCDAIARRESVDLAVQRARQAMQGPLQDQQKFVGTASTLLAENLGQWALPLLLSHDPAHPLIDWNFTPAAAHQMDANQRLQAINLPARFIGRRAELRTLQHQLENDTQRQLLITGPGGQGKTTLAGKLAQDLVRRGYQLFAWSARPEQRREDFLLEVELALVTGKNGEANARMLQRIDTADEARRAQVLLRLLLQQAEGKLVLFFDNLESVQDPATHTLNDALLHVWIAAAQGLTAQGLILLLTSRWQLPDWPDDERHWPLTRATYGDFLQMALQLVREDRLPAAFLRDRAQETSRLQRVYRTLHGNGRALTFFAAAIQAMDLDDEAIFLTQLAQASAEAQTDMALAQIVSQLSAPATALLQRLPAYQSAVPTEGIVKIATDLPEPISLLRELTAVSLVERPYAADLQTVEYQLSALVAAWLREQGVALPEPTIYQQAASYQFYLFRNERRTLTQAIVVHQAQQAAGEIEAAHRFALDWIVGRFNRNGLYQTLLDEWLPAICTSADAQTRGEALGQTGKQHLHLGN